MSRNRKQDSSGEQLQYWHSVVQGLRTLPQPQDTGFPKRFQHAMGEGASDGESVPKQVRDDAISQLEQDERATQHEITTLHNALESLNVLLALQSHHSPPPVNTHIPAAVSSASLLASSSAPVPAPAPAVPARLKVSLHSGSSASPSHHPPAASPAASSSRQASITRSSPAPAQYGTPGSSGGSRDQAATTVKKGRGPGKANLLEKGRRVAYRAPDSTDEWLMYRVLDVVREGKGKDPTYTIQDFEIVDEKGRTIPLVTTTLRHMIPVPDPNASTSHASHPTHYPDYALGADVLALFPDTTSFYEAVVVGREKAKGGLRDYKLMFQEDDNQTRTISAADVIAPKGK